MRKIISILFLFFALNFSARAQTGGLNLGINGGVTIGNLDGRSQMAIGADANYLFNIYDNIKLGPSVNFLYFFMENIGGIKPDPLVYMPIGGALRFSTLEDDFYIGVDGGFAIGISPKGDRGGIFIKPMIGYNVNEKLRVNLFYSGVKKRDPTYGFIGVGVEFTVFRKDNSYHF